jgi:hypothetical protein
VQQEEVKAAVPVEEAPKKETPPPPPPPPVAAAPVQPKPVKIEKSKVADEVRQPADVLKVVLKGLYGEDAVSAGKHASTSCFLLVGLAHV